MQNTIQPNFKEEISASFGQSYAPDSHFTRPVNNFLKEPEEIEKELVEEFIKTREFYMCINGKYIPASEILRMPMEENY